MHILQPAVFFAALSVASARSLAARAENNVFEHRQTASTIRYVTNSGICEKTAGVQQVSGYLSVGSNMVRSLYLHLTTSSLIPCSQNMWFCALPSRRRTSSALTRPQGSLPRARTRARRRSPSG